MHLGYVGPQNVGTILNIFNQEKGKKKETYASYIWTSYMMFFLSQEKKEDMMCLTFGLILLYGFQGLEPIGVGGCHGVTIGEVIASDNALNCRQ